ncbi:hypothetical protein FS837_000920 [Tulasnella sp. UAMH 9824]|nr:hypothetical protein FS837_000920 [Tulasnella sp. UAMH 9824]
MSSTGGPSSKPTASQKKEKKSKTQSASKSPQEKPKASGSGPSNDAPSKPLATNKKPVLRPVLDNPLKIEWPNIPLNVENNILAVAVQLLETVRPFHEQRSEAMRRAKTADRARGYKGKAVDQIEKRRSKKGKSVPTSESATTEGRVSSEGTASTLKRKREASVSGDESDESEESSGLPPSKRRKPDERSAPHDATAPLAPKRPEMLDHVVLGLNAVTKRLEAQSFALRSPSNSNLPQPRSASSEALPTAQSAHSDDDQPKKLAPLRLVLVCRTDVDSPTMIAHLPTLTASCNSAQRPPTQAHPSFPDVLIVGLPYGAESTLAEGAGLRRAAVVAFDTETPGLEERIAPLLPSIPILRAHWLAVAPAASASSGSSNHPGVKNQLVPTHVKHLRTTAPQDPKATKQKRTEEIRETKDRRRRGSKDSRATEGNSARARGGDKGGGKGEAGDGGGPGGSATIPKDKRAPSCHQKSKIEREKVTTEPRPKRTLEKVILRTGAPNPPERAG